jgi:hypothetical protein
MKFILFQLLFISSNGYSQNANIGQLRFYASKKFFNPQHPYITIIYPIIVTKNKRVNEKTNEKIKTEVFGSDKSENIHKVIKKSRNNGLTNLSYKVTFNKNDILSLNIYTQENSGNHLYENVVYLNFDLKSGKLITLSDLIHSNYIDSFQFKAFSDNRDSIENYKKEVKKLQEQNKIDSLTFQYFNDEITNNCFEATEFRDFILSSKYVEIIPHCEFQSGLKYLEPVFHLRYVYTSILNYLTTNYRTRLLK